MTKEEVQQRVLYKGKPIPLDKFTWDESTNTFSGELDHLVLYFNGCDYCTFKTGSDCVFNTGYNCTFKTGYNCTFNTADYCTFNTGSDCVFKTDDYCVFNTCDFCTFDVGDCCTFNTWNYCTFNVGEKCVVVRRDKFQVHTLQKGLYKMVGEHFYNSIDNPEEFI